MLRVLTLNTWNREGPWEKRRELLHAWLGRLQPDVIGLQEAKDDVQARERQMPQLATFARSRAERAGFPPILVGDLNADDDSAEIRYLKGRQSLGGTSAYFVDAWEFGGDGSPGVTWSRTNGFADVWHFGDRRLDYIFVGHPRLADGSGRVERCEVVCNTAENGVWPSDHFGVFAVLRT